jgi:hypothetical protein
MTTPWLWNGDQTYRVPSPRGLGVKESRTVLSGFQKLQPLSALFSDAVEVAVAS